MQPSSQCIIMRPWIIAENKLQTLTKYLILPVQSTEEPSTLISVLALKQQMVPMISNLQFCNEGAGDGEIMVYLSNQVRVGSQLYQIAYLPGQTKLQSDCAISLANILRDLSQVVISDVNCSTLHKIRDRPILPGCRQYVVINGRDIYSVGGGQNKIQLLKKLEGSLGTGLIHPQFLNVGGKTANIGKLQQVMNDYLCDWQLMLQGERSWATFTASVLQHFKIEEWLWQDSIKLRQMKYNGLMLSLKEIQMLQAQIYKICNHSSTWQQKISKSVINKIMKQIKQENQQNLEQHLLELKQNFTATSIFSLSELQIKQKAVQQTLKHYGIPISLSACVTAEKQKQLLQSIIHQTQRQIQQAKVNLALIQKEQADLNAKLNHYTSHIQELNRNAAETKYINKQFEEIQQHLNSEKHENRKLRLELQSHIYMEKRNSELKNDLEAKIQEGNIEREGLLAALQQLTQQNLALMSEKQGLQIEIVQLKQRVEEQEHIEARALRSIENQAEIQVRLTRYENYVKQLKSSLSSFKKVEVEKFNYILERNYHQYKLLKQHYQVSQKDLKHANEQLKQLKDNLQSEKLRMSYFQKIVLSSLQNESIPEVSEQNSSDRNQIPA